VADRHPSWRGETANLETQNSNLRVLAAWYRHDVHRRERMACLLPVFRGKFKHGLYVSAVTE
jgi:hypothetical protein